jgi:peptidoglycan/xylan/chitin deacetylase (PgdA/CDA1 family)
VKAIMYHYVRPFNPVLPYFTYLDLNNFRHQLDWFQDNMPILSLENFLSAIKNGVAPKEGTILTFDDGLSDHYNYVLPELEKRGLWGFFYIPTGVHKTKNLLDVHRTHFLLGQMGGSSMLRAVMGVIEEGMISESHRATFQDVAYHNQTNEKDIATVKSILNYQLLSEHRTPLLGTLMREFGDEEIIFQEFYMSSDQIIDLHERGMIVGSHSVSHPIFSTLTREEQSREILESFSFIESVIGELAIRSFCYPYGHPSTFTKETEELLDEANCQFAFKLSNQEIQSHDLVKTPQALPRIDCNQFPHGEASRGPLRDNSI